MTAGENYITLPNFLIPYRDGGVEDYADAPETVGKIVLAVASKIFKGADISENLSPCERGVYRHWLKVANDGLEKARREREKCQKAAAAKWAKSASGEPQQAAHPSGGRSSEPVPASEPAPVPARSPAPVSAPVRRSVPHPSGGERRGGAIQIGECLDCLNIPAMANGDTGGSIEYRINKDPVNAALEIIGEKGDKLSENTLKKYLRTKGAAAFIDTLFRFYSEIKQGEGVSNMGAALNARLKELPDIAAKGTK